MNIHFIIFGLALGFIFSACVYCISEFVFGARFRAKFLAALDRGDVAKIVRSSVHGVDSYDLAEFYHVNQTWLVMQCRLAGFKTSPIGVFIFAERISEKRNQERY